MAQLTPSGEVGVFVDFNQFETGKSPDTCGPAAIAMFWHQVKPGEINRWTSKQCLAMMESDYAHYIGPDVASDTNGTSDSKLYEMLEAHRFQYLAIPKNVELIRTFLEQGYTVIAGVKEATIHDEELNGNPYSWNTSGLYHIICFTGPAQAGTLLARDTANVGESGIRQGPRRYSTFGLELTSATVVVPTWLPGF